MLNDSCLGKNDTSSYSVNEKAPSFKEGATHLGGQRISLVIQYSHSYMDWLPSA